MSVKRILISVGIVVGTFSAIAFASASTWSNLPVDGSGNVTIGPTSSLSGNVNVSGTLSIYGVTVPTSTTGGSGGASTSSPNTWTAPQTFATSTQTTIDSVIYASAQTSTADYNAYLNNLCTNVASGTLIQIPQGKMNVSSTLSITQHCTYRGVGGGGTVFQWTGAQGGTMINQNWGLLPQVEGGGVQNLTLNCGSATTTNPTVGLLEGGLNGASHSDNDGLTIMNCGTGLESASNTYMTVLGNSTVVLNGRNFQFDTANNSGESIDFMNVKSLDCANSTTTKCDYFAPNSIENGTWVGGAVDDVQSYYGNGVNFSYYGVNHENPGYATYGRYDYEQLADSFYGTIISYYGGNFQNDATNTAQTPLEFVNGGGIAEFYGTELSKGSGVATSVPELFNNGINSVDGIGMACGVVNQNNSGNAVTSIFPAGNTSNSENWGCLVYNQNNYVQGVDYTSGNTNFYTHGGVAMSLLNANGSLSLFNNVTLGTTGTTPGCAEMYEAGATSTIGYMYIKAGAVVGTTTKPLFCP